MENEGKLTWLRRIRHNLDAIEVIELSGLAMLLNLVLGLIASFEVKDDVGLFWLGMGGVMYGSILAALFL